MLVGGQEGINEAKETPKRSSIKHNLGEVVEIGIKNSGRGYLGKSSLGSLEAKRREDEVQD